MISFSEILKMEGIEINIDKHGGIPVLKGTRYTLAQLFAEIADGRSIYEIAEDFELDVESIKQFLNELSISFNRLFIY